MKAPHLSWSMVAFLLAAVLAASAPFVGPSRGTAATSVAARFPGWPAEHDGQRLTALPLSAREAAFTHDFPGRVGRFTDGRREIILRWVDQPTRKLHPASDCLRAVGYAITPQAVRTDTRGAAMGCFRATKDGAAMMVCESLHDAQARTWPDVSAWYWSAMFERSPGPWWSVVVAEGE